ncbi:uncharacterized protein LOC113148652 isoform X2 [Anabas testudineus]|uniref:uncharacterized protein LOC113148652 isoform X2 n=1 Tax=Anabas testudineus TaxID=64144 RepID=UPI000E460EA4|nr:uncharacterized protein LOC113148652 isoform X2 [Anabas testudineus]
MKKSEKVPQLKVLPTIYKSVTLNQIVPTNVRHSCIDADFHQSPHKGEQVNPEFENQPAHVVQHVGLMQHREPDERGSTAACMNLHHQPPVGCCLYPAGNRQSNIRAECCCWDCALNQCGTTDSETTVRVEDECDFQLESDEEELEPPLPLRSDDEWQFYNPFLTHQHYTQSYGIHQAMGMRYYTEEGQYTFNPDNRYPPQPCYHSPWKQSQPWLRDPNCMHDKVAQGSVSVNVPQFSVPPVEGMSQVSVMDLNSAGAETSVLHSHEKKRTISLPDECRNIFITYSSDASSEIVPFVDFLTKHGFRPAVNIYDKSIRCMDINKWKDSYLNDPSILIVIAITPKYKSDIEGSVVDSHGLHTKYIHSIMQNEFIQQGSLNFRFIPVLFLNASQKHVPSWLQNTYIYRWPQDTEDLLLRLLRVERYVPPAVPLELTLIIKPVALNAAAAL